jgi:hypothetical protein
MIENGHEKGLVARHQCCWGGTWYTMLDDEEMKNTLGNKQTYDTAFDFFPMLKIANYLDLTE